MAKRKESRVNSGMEPEWLFEELVNAIDDLTATLDETGKQAFWYNIILGTLTAVIAILTSLMVWKMFVP